MSKIMLSAFRGKLKGLVDVEPKNVIYMVVDSDLTDMYGAVGKETLVAAWGKKARFERTRKFEKHFQYGELPIYELRGIE